jgi:endo-1,4-beta-xylanase
MDGHTRRDWFGLMAAGAAMAAVPASAASAPSVQAGDSLAALARAKGLTGFGSAIGGVGRPGSPFTDEGVREIHLRECNIMVHENDLKWTVVRPNPTDFNFHNADRLITWAEQNGMKVRGHTLTWLRPDRNPDWLNNYDFGSRPGAEAERMVREHISTVCRRYGDRIFSWDVVNEAIDPRTGGLRTDAFSRHLGENLLDIAFDAAREAVPNAVLVYNDFMTWGPNSARHREGVLALLQRMKGRGVPVHMLGVQAHIGAGEVGDVVGTMTFDAREEADWKSFMDAAVGMGHRLAITELDVSETGTPADVDARDRVMADLLRRYMDMMLRYRELDHIMAWGMLDAYSWLQSRTRRLDGRLKRPALYDTSYRPKLMREAMAAALRAAPPR